MTPKEQMPDEIVVVVRGVEWSWEIRDASVAAGFICDGASIGSNGRELYFRKPVREPRQPESIEVNLPEPLQ